MLVSAKARFSWIFHWCFFFSDILGHSSEADEQRIGWLYLIKKK